MGEGGNGEGETGEEGKEGGEEGRREGRRDGEKKWGIGGEKIKKK